MISSPYPSLKKVFFLMGLIFIFNTTLLKAQQNDKIKQEILEVEPNQNTKEISQEMRIEEILLGKLDSNTDTDGFFLTIPKESVYSFKFSFTSPQYIEIKIGSFFSCSLFRHEIFDQRNYLFPAGKHLVLLVPNKRSVPCEYRFEIDEATHLTQKEIEPNDKPETAFPIQVGEFISGEISSSNDVVDIFAADFKNSGIYQLTFSRSSSSEETKDFLYARIHIKRKKEKKILYKYRCDLPQFKNYFFYPVLTPGKYLISIYFYSKKNAVGEAYKLEVSHCSELKTTLEDRKKAQQAIDDGEKWLLVNSPRTLKSSAGTAGSILKLMALSEGEKTKEKEEVIQEELLQLEKNLKKNGEGLWHEKPMYYIVNEIYLQAILVLGLGEIAAKGNLKAKELCEKLVPYLLASQLTKHRIPEWGGPYTENSYYGGWRYNHQAKNGDISIVGWCIVALFAADTSDVQIPGIESAVENALSFIERCGDPNGFFYQNPNNNSANIHNSIGALMMLLFGRKNDSLRAALEDIDHHFCAGTQVDTGADYPFYYWYYATRLNYLRGGVFWENWRTIMIQQLLKTQKNNGSWEGIREEVKINTLYSTALAIMILQICLDNPPSYLKKEMEGF